MSNESQKFIYNNVAFQWVSEPCSFLFSGVFGFCGRGRAVCGRMCEGPSRISGPIPPDPTLFPEYYKRPFSGESLMLVAGLGVCALA